MASACVHIVIKNSDKERLIYNLVPYNFKVTTIPTSSLSKSYTKYVDSVDTYRDNLDYRYKYEELKLDSEQTKRLSDVNDIIETDTSINLSIISNYIQEVSDYITSGFISPKTSCKILLPLVEKASSLTRFKFIEKIIAFIKQLRKDKICAGVAYKGMIFDADSSSVNNLGGLVLAFMAGINNTITYKTKDGKFYTIDSLEVCKELYQVLYRHVQAAFKSESMTVSHFSGLTDSQLEDIYITLTTSNSSGIAEKFEEFYTKAVKDLKGE